MTTTLSVMSCSLLVPLDGASSGGEEAPKGDAAGGDGAAAITDGAAGGGDSTIGPPSDSSFVADAKAPELTGLIGYWSFDEGAGNIANDFSGRGHVATLIGGPKWVAGHSGTALLTDGANDRVRVAALDGLAFPSSGTLSVWFRSDDASGEFILDQYDPDRDHIMLRVRPAEDTRPLRIETYFMVKGTDSGVPIVFGSFAPITLGTWMHVVIVWDTVARQASYYLDNTLIKQAGLAMGWRPRDQSFELTREGCCGGFVGALDEIRLYDRALSPAEVALVP